MHEKRSFSDIDIAIMVEVSHPMDSNSVETYGFRFVSSDQLLHLTQQQIDLIPYLSVLMTHKNDFASIENENGEYLLNEPMKYFSFVSILRSISSRNPYRLFDELPEDEDVFDTLQLYDYLGLSSFPLPLLRCTNLVRSKSVKNEEKKQKIKYHEASLSEVRRTAGEFIIGLAKNEYKLSDPKTIDTIFNLINIILFNAGVFNLRFRDHSLAIAKKRCYSFLSKNQRHQLDISHRLPQYEKMNSNKFWNTFSWRGIYVPIEDNHTNSLSSITLNKRLYNAPLFYPWNPRTRVNEFNNAFRRIRYLYSSIRMLLSRIKVDDVPHVRVNRAHYSASLYDFQRFINDLQADERITEVQSTDDEREILINKLKQNPRKKKGRLRHFNTPFPQMKFNKFKHRCGPKAQKYR